MNNSDKDCNECEHYDPCEGVCKITGEDHHGYDDDCNDFKQETDTMEGEDGYCIHREKE